MNLIQKTIQRALGESNMRYLGKAELEEMLDFALSTYRKKVKRFLDDEGYSYDDSEVIKLLEWDK